MEKQMNRTVVKKTGFVRAAFAVGAAIPLFIVSAYAQDPSPSPSGEAVPNAAAPASTGSPNSAPSAERIIVTGSYIPTAETESALPVTEYTAEVITKQGAQTPIEGLRQLPSFVGNTASENDSNGGDGTALINLRGLGDANTLTLINGRRAFDFADINAISIGALDRTEILKDGASSVYGSDAVAGVVNFIMLDGPGETPYQGAEMYALYGNTTDTDAHVRQFYLRGGVVGMDGKFAVAASGEYYSRANLFARDRRISSTGDLSDDATGLGLDGLNNNSPTFSGRVSTNSGGELVLINPTTVDVTPASYRPFDVVPGTDPSRFNFDAFAPAIPAMEKFMYYTTASYKVFGDALQLYGDVMYSHITQDNGLASSPFAIIDGVTASQAYPNGDFPVVLNSPFNPFGTDLTGIRYRLVQELNNRRSFFDKDFWRYTAAARGDIDFKGNDFISHFGYDSGFVYNRGNELEADSGDATRSGIDNAIAAGNFDPFIGQSAPDSGLAPTYINGVPTGLMAPYDNGASAAAASFIATTQFLDRDYLVDAKFNAHLFPNLYNGGIDIAGGYEHRQVRLQTIADNLQEEGDQLGFDSAANSETTTSVDSVFAELEVPFVTSTMNVPGIRSLELSIAWRYESFDEEDNMNKGVTAHFDNSNPDEDFGGTPRLALRYQPISDLTLRATASQSFLAPSATQLFQPVFQTFPQLFDPLKGLTLQPVEGVYEGGNRLLLPERTDNLTAGLVYSPHFIPNLTITADYYNLFTTNLILDADSFAQLALTENGNSGGVAFADPDGPGAGVFGGGPQPGVTRDSHGNVLAIDSVNANAGERNVQGIDFTAQYQIPTTNWGTFTLSGGFNHFITYKIQPIAGGGFTNFLGNYNNGTLPLAPGAIPFNKAFLRGEWEFKGFDFVATGNYVGDYWDDPNFILGNFQNGGTDANPSFAFNRHVTEYVTLDLQLGYTFPKPAPVEAAPAPGYSKDAKDAKDGKAMEQTSAMAASNSASFFQRLLWDTKLTVGVDNAFDRSPPTVLGAFNDNYDTESYSERDRFYYVSLTKKF
jgi:iron complex outermembrane receptor protein